MIILISGYANCAGAHRLDIRLPRLHVPAKENSYICLEYDLPDNDDFHLTAGVPIIDNHITMGGIMVFACGNYSSHLLNATNKFILQYSKNILYRGTFQKTKNKYQIVQYLNKYLI